VLRGRDRVDDGGTRGARDRPPNRLDDPRRSEHPGLDCVGADVVQDRIDLLGDRVRGHLVEAGDAQRVLHGDRRDGRCAVYTMRK
jgi:hypothetical protein